MLTTRVLATSGHATVAGVDVVADPVRTRAGLAVVPQRPNLDRELTARRCRLSDLTRVVTVRGKARATPSP